MKFYSGQRVWQKDSKTRDKWIFVCLRYEGSGYWRGYYEKTDVNVDHIHESNFEGLSDPNDLLKAML